MQPLKALELPVPAEVQFVALNTTAVKPVQLLKALSPIEDMDFPIITDISCDHPENMFEGMDLIPSPKTKVVMPVQPKKASPLSQVTELGIVTEVKPLQP